MGHQRKKFSHLILILLFLFSLFSSSVSITKICAANQFSCSWGPSFWKDAHCKTTANQCSSTEAALVNEELDDGYKYSKCEDYIDSQTCPVGQHYCIPYCSGDKRCYEGKNCPTGFTKISPAICTETHPICCQKLNLTPPLTPPVDNGVPDSETKPESIINIDELIGSQGLNPKFFGSNVTLGNFISTALPYLYAIAGIGLLIYLIAAGLSYLTSAGDPKKIEAAKSRLTSAILGFIIIFAAFWITQIVNYIFKLGTSLQ